MKKIFVTLLTAFVFCVSLAKAADYDLIDPRLPSHKSDLLWHIKVSEGFSHNYQDSLTDSTITSRFNRLLLERINQRRDCLLTYKDEKIKSYLSFNWEENWLGINENDQNISNLQSSLTFRGSAVFRDKIEFEHEVKIFMSDSTFNLDSASTTGEFLHHPLLSYNFPYRGAVTSDSYTIEVQTDKALIKTDLWGFKLQTGRDRLQFKTGFRNSLLMSGLARPIDMFYRVDYKYWIIGYTAIAGQMTDAGKRYISLKRIYFQFADWLQLGGTEGVAYYDDPMAYINPMLFFYFVHRHRPSNEDNLIATYDISVTPVKSLNIYFEFLNDDFIIFNGGASKYGFCTGFLKTGLLDERFDIRAEYTQVRKWTYSHVSQLNMWEYRGQPLGFWLGTDADEFYARADYIFTPTTIASINFNYLRNGEGSLYLPYEEEGGDKTPPFPSGTVEKSTGGWLDIHHEIGKFEIRGRIGYRQIKNRHNAAGDFDSFFTHWGMSLIL